MILNSYFRHDTFNTMYTETYDPQLAEDCINVLCTLKELHKYHSNFGDEITNHYFCEDDSYIFVCLNSNCLELTLFSNSGYIDMFAILKIRF